MRQTKNIVFIPSNDIKIFNSLSGTKTLLRCKEALRLWRAGKYDFIVVSGGRTYKKEIQTIPAADLMKLWLISNKVDENKILSEDKSLDTYTNIHYSLKLLEQHNIAFENLAVVSHWIHLKRIRTILWNNYKIRPICIPVKYKLSLEWLHEIIWLFYLLFDKTGNGFFEKKVRQKIKKRASL